MFSFIYDLFGFGAKARAPSLDVDIEDGFLRNLSAHKVNVTGAQLDRNEFLLTFEFGGKKETLFIKTRTERSSTIVAELAQQ